MYPGSEPGIDPRRVTANLTYGQFKRACHIEIAEYDANNASLRQLTNDELVRLMETGQENPKTASDDPNSSIVRWINIGGLDWDVISAVALRYNLHVLALEDVLHEQGHIQSKADYFYEHLFIRILCHRLDRDNDEAGQHNEGSHIPDPRTEFPETWLEDGRLAFRQIQATKSSPTPVSPPCDSNPPAKRHTMSKGLTGFIGTVITIHPKPSLDYTAPIRERILQPESVLRTSEDASLLVEALLDLGINNPFNACIR
ncbi:hypothetical protein H0H93_014555 [Arthromyces matolae]|nr:hypothetical protein H0H93_014555 [Arthromyces matolae]